MQIDINSRKQLNKPENYSAFYSLLNGLPTSDRDALKESIVSQYTEGRTTSLRDMTLKAVSYTHLDYDLSCHQKGSGRPLEYFDEETREKFIPHVVEPSAGIEVTIGGKSRTYEVYSSPGVPDHEWRRRNTCLLYTSSCV